MRGVPPTVLGLTINSTTVGGYSSGHNGTTGVFTITLPITATIPPGGVLVLTYTVRVDSDVLAGIDLSNQAQASWNSLAGEVASERDYGPITDTTTVHTPLATTLSKESTPPTVTIGSQVVFTIAVPNPVVGAMLYNVVFTDDVDSRLQINAVSNAFYSGQRVTMTWASIPTFTQQIVVITTTVRDANTVTDGAQITNVASFDYASNPGGPMDSNVVTTTVQVPALVVNKTVNDSTVNPGDVITFTVTVQNVGSGTAYNVNISDTLPSPGFEYIAGTSQLNGAGISDPVGVPNPTGPQLTWYITRTLAGGTPVGEAITLTFQVSVTNAVITGTHTNYASAIDAVDELSNTVPTDNSDHVPDDTDADDRDDEDVTVGTNPGIEVHKAVSADQVFPPATITYTLVLTNTGNVVLDPVQVTDTLDAGLNYADQARVNSAPDEPDDNVGPEIVWNDVTGSGVMNPGDVITVTFQVTVTDAVGTYTNTVDVSGTDTSGGVVTDTDDVPVQVLNHVLQITKTASSATVTPGGFVTYTLAYAVIGTEIAPNVVITDAVPQHTTFYTATGGITRTTPSVGGTGVVTWELGDIDPSPLFPNPATGVVTLVVQADSIIPDNTVIPNTAFISDDEGVKDNDDEPVTTQAPALKLSKSSEVSRGGGLVYPGDTITYTICYSNSGSLTATNVVITDMIPHNTTYITGSATAPNGETLQWYTSTNWVGAEPAPASQVEGLRWLTDTLAPNSTYCVQFRVQVNMAIVDAGSLWIFTREGWMEASAMTPTPTVTPTLTPTLASTVIPTVTPTAMVTPTPTATVTPTAPIVTPTPTSTATEVPTETLLSEATPTATATQLPIEEPTAAETLRPVPTEVPTVPLTEEPTAEPEVTNTATPTPTEENDATPEANGSNLILAARSWLGSIIVSLGEPLLAVGEILLIQEASPTPTEAPTPTATSTEVPTEAPVEEPIPTVTSTTVPTETPTEEATATETPTEVPTQEATSTPVESPTATPETASPTPTASATATPAASPTMVISPTATITVTAGPTATATPTITPTVPITPAATITPAPTVTPTVTITPTATVTLTEAPIVLQQLHTSGITNTATIDSDQTEPESDEEQNPFPPGIELVDPVIGKIATPPYAHPGQEVTFTLTVRNQGIAQAQNVRVTDTVPTFLDAFAATTTKGTVQPIVNNTVVVYVGTLEPYGTEVVTITVRTRVRSGTPAGTLMNNLAVVACDGGDDQDDAPVQVPDEEGDDREGPPPPAPTPTPAPTAPVTPTPTPEILTVAILPETGAGPSLLSALVGLSIMIGLASLLLLALPRREGNYSDSEEG